MRDTHESKPIAPRRPRRHWRGPIGTLILGVAVGVMVAVTISSRPPQVRDARPVF